MVTHRCEKFWFYSHDVIDRPSVRPYVRTYVVRPPLHVCQCDQYHASLQHTSLIFDQLTLVKTRYPLTSITQFFRPSPSNCFLILPKDALQLKHPCCYRKVRSTFTVLNCHYPLFLHIIEADISHVHLISRLFKFSYISLIPKVWFQNRRARWRKHEIKNKPAPGILQSENRQPICDVTPRTIFQTSPVIFPPLHSVPFRPWEPFYAPFSTTHWIPPRETLEFSHCHNTAAHVTQAANEMFQLLGSASATRSPSPTSSLATLYQASWVYDSDSGESHHSTDDYVAAVTLASCFQRQN